MRSCTILTPILRFFTGTTSHRLITDMSQGFFVHPTAHDTWFAFADTNLHLVQKQLWQLYRFAKLPMDPLVSVWLHHCQ